MYRTIMLAAALQRWDRYSAHALAARDVAASLAGSAAKALHVLSVYEYDRMPTSLSGLPAEVAARLREQQKGEKQHTDALMRQKLGEYTAPLAAQGLEVASILRVGNPRDIVLEVAREIQADLLVIGSHSKRGLLDVMLGGTAQHVARHAPCTVILVSPKR